MHERTAEERERDRQERERRRAQREGAPVPTPQERPAPPPAPEAAPPAAPPAEAAPPSEVVAPSTEELAPVDFEHAEPERPASVYAEPEQAAPVYEEPKHAESEHTEPEQPAPIDAEPEPPLPAPAQPALSTPLSSPSYAPPPKRPRGGSARRPGGAHPGRGITRARVAALLALLLAAALVWFLISLFQPFTGEGQGRVIVTIPKGSSASKIGSILAREGVVSSGFFFDVRALVEGKRGALHSGRFALKRDMSYAAAIDALSKPPPKAIVVKVVIPEGYTRRQISDLVREDSLSGDYLAASKRSSLLNPRDYGAPKGTPSLEGFLFPATYELRAGTPVKRLVDEQLRAFRGRFTKADRRRAHALGVTPYELLTVASLVEREAQTEHDRPLIAAVIYNRLKEGIPIGIDAAIYYAVELQKGIATYTGELTQSMLAIDSPYNTRTHKGLPPTPIANPGEASIHAAAHPAHAPYLYYVAGADGCGEQVFSKTNAEFEQDVAAYDAAVKKNGGKPPACKKK